MTNKPKLGEPLKSTLKNLSFDEQRAAIGLFLRSQSGGKLWDLLTGLRGPDSPSEKPGDYHSETYKLRRKRKYDTVEVIREAAFFGVVGGAARYHKAETVTIPSSHKWDHFDKHVSRAASAIGLGVEYYADGQGWQEGAGETMKGGL